MSGKTFQSSSELYGIDPKILAKKPYDEALLIMGAGLWKRKRKLADELFECTDGEESSRLQNEMRKVTKAIALNDMKIEELK